MLNTIISPRLARDKRTKITLRKEDVLCRQMWCRKLGLSSWAPPPSSSGAAGQRGGGGSGGSGGSGAKVLWEQLEPLLRQSAVDWTLFWRQLAVRWTSQSIMSSHLDLLDIDIVDLVSVPVSLN